MNSKLTVAGYRLAFTCVEIALVYCECKMMCVQHLEVNNYSVAHADGENASLTSKAGALFVSVVFGSQEKRTSIEKSWDQDGRFEWKAPQIELWDGESGEIVEFIVSVERNGVRWRDSMTTVTVCLQSYQKQHII